MDHATELLQPKTIETKKIPEGLRFLWYSDLYRYTGRVSPGNYLKAILRIPGFRYSFFYRLCTCLRRKKTNPLKSILYRLVYEILRQISIRYGIVIHPDVQIEPGLYIVNFGGIFVNPQTIIGKNCNISQSVIIGPTNRGQQKGCPIIGDNVFIGPGALIAGRIKVGNNVAIGGNAVVTKNIPDNAVVIGNPGVIVSYKGSQGYINRTEYEQQWLKRGSRSG